MTGEGGIVLRRRTALEQIDLAAVLLRAEGGKIVGATMPAWLFAALAAALLWQLDPWFGVVVGLLLGRLAQVPALLAVSDRVSGRPADVSAGRVFRSTFSVAVNGTVNLFLLGMASWLIVLPPVLWVRWLFAPEVLVLERPESGARGRISALVSGGAGEAMAARFWQVSIEVWAALAAAMLGELVVTEVLQLGAPFGDWSGGDASPFFLVGALAAQPLLSIVRFCAYLELRTQREGLDAWFAVYSAAAAGEGR